MPSTPLIPMRAEEGQLPQADAEGRAVRQEKEQRQQRRTAEIAQGP